ncbi:MAG TPA: AI-2E family transporter [Rudaea sp.]|nr:AI-2E family transporter [Rudaea sp.]
MSTVLEPEEAAVVPEHPTRNRLLAGILLLLVLYTCAAAAVLIVPLLLALLLSLMLAPAVRFLCRWRLPRSLATLLVLLSTVMLAGVLLLSLVGPARAWMVQLPKSLARIELALNALRQPLRAATHAGEQIAELANVAGDNDKLQHVVDPGPSRIAQMLSATPAAIASTVATLLLIFIFLLHGDALLRKFVELAPALHLKKDIVFATRSAQYELSTYIIAIAAINTVLGLLTATALWWLGVDNPLLWGGVAAVLNFAPFVGPMVTVSLLVVVGFARFDTPLAALGVPGTFLLLHLIEGQLVTPLIVGRRLALDPVMVFIALMLFGWLWGVAGLLLAMPLLSCIRIVAERVPAWNALGKLLAA